MTAEFLVQRQEAFADALRGGQRCAAGRVAEQVDAEGTGRQHPRDEVHAQVLDRLDRVDGEEGLGDVGEIGRDGAIVVVTVERELDVHGPLHLLGRPCGGLHPRIGNPPGVQDAAGR
ncbi:hypothetical protein CQZ88_08250 [Rhodococcus sp. ENV425]|nr:hypothetical protein CQZ88_08250 [Rhodococcus sp. ENV425]